MRHYLLCMDVKYWWTWIISVSIFLNARRDTRTYFNRTPVMYMKITNIPYIDIVQLIYCTNFYSCSYPNNLWQSDIARLHWQRWVHHTSLLLDPLEKIWHTLIESQIFFRPNNYNGIKLCLLYVKCAGRKKVGFILRYCQRCALRIMREYGTKTPISAVSKLSWSGSTFVINNTDNNLQSNNLWAFYIYSAKTSNPF